jgi:hypothetical protein
LSCHDWHLQKLVATNLRKQKNNPLYKTYAKQIFILVLHVDIISK